MPKIGVLCIHGVGRKFAGFSKGFETGVRATIRELSKIDNKKFEEDIVFEEVVWSKIVDRHHRAVYEGLTSNANQGYNHLREKIVRFAGDAIGFQSMGHRSSLVSEIHGLIGDHVCTLERFVGDSAPMCIVAHSLGTIIARSYLSELQAKFLGLRSRVSEDEFHKLRVSPFRRGETLKWLYFMGSPLPFWNRIYPGSGKPFIFPVPRVEHFLPTIKDKGEWVNFYAHADLLGYPIKRLNFEFSVGVTEDIKVSFGPLKDLIWNWLPCVHTRYWNCEMIHRHVGNKLWEGLVLQS